MAGDSKEPTRTKPKGGCKFSITKKNKTVSLSYLRSVTIQDLSKRTAGWKAVWGFWGAVVILLTVMVQALPSDIVKTPETSFPSGENVTSAAVISPSYAGTDRKN